MPKCPKCGKEIEELICVTEGTAKYLMRLNEKGDAEYIFLYAPIEDEVYRCPECDAKLFDTPDEAIRFLTEEMKVAQVS